MASLLNIGFMHGISTATTAEKKKEKLWSYDLMSMICTQMLTDVYLRVKQKLRLTCTHNLWQALEAQLETAQSRASGNCLAGFLQTVLV